MESILKRIEQIAINEGIKITSFEKIIGASKGVLSRAIANGTDIQSKWLQSIIENYPQYSGEWLLTGKGSMLKSKADENYPQEIRILHKPKISEKRIDQQSIKLYDVAAAANLKTIFDNKDQNILGEISIPDIPRCDGAVYVQGDSMYPILKAGDIIAYKEIYDFRNVIFGEMYLISFDIEGDDYLTVKYLNRSDRGDDYVKLVSYNPHHDPKDIPLSTINALALVKFSIRKNTML